MNYGIPLIVGVVALACGIALGFVIEAARRKFSGRSLGDELKRAREEAERESKALVLEAKDKAASIIEGVAREERERKEALARIEERLFKKDETIEKEKAELAAQTRALREREEAVGVLEREASKLREAVQKELARVSGLPIEEARAELVREIRESSRDDLAHLMQKLERDTRAEVERREMEIVAMAIQRYSRSHVTDITTTAFQLPGEDLKGKIIGREGRNIRTLERLTGVEFVIDETPDTILISSFDPFRREVARLALQKLIADGRIQPAKIEEKVSEAQSELEARIQEIGSEAAYDLGIVDLPKEITQLLGRLHFRTSYGQNVLAHSIEVAHLSAMMAEELHLNVEAAKRGGLVHDIGKAIDHEVQGNHVELGIKILRKHGVPDAIVEAMQSHHEEYPFARPEAYLVAAADALSAARPGARRGTLEHYLKRLADLEKIASQFPEVKQSYAISAGRELRVFVVPEKIDDFGALELAKNIARTIESELQYPGEIKVNVIREVRAVEYAR
ncbi:MAG: ribonuclease Y [Candidatus Colwellbacteria bacterium]|nr:ribonuclease Y [Candidatus Colwellbacteria bacterium]